MVSDTHGDFSWLPAFCEENQTTYYDAIIITGDHGFLYYGSGQGQKLVDSDKWTVDRECWKLRFLQLL